MGIILNKVWMLLIFYRKKPASNCKCTCLVLVGCNLVNTFPGVEKKNISQPWDMWKRRGGGTDKFLICVNHIK